jgi:hypothetical protein
VSGTPDNLPFPNATAMRSTFEQLDLPLSYYQICDGSLTLAFSFIKRDPTGKAVGYNFAAHRITKQGDWTIALSHSATLSTTSAYLSTEACVDSSKIIRDLEEYKNDANDPTLLLCIMFYSIARDAKQRRRSLKDRLHRLEDAIKNFDRKASFDGTVGSASNDYDKNGQDLESFFKILESCRKDQDSRNGRYEFWRSYKDALDRGFKYTKEIMSNSPNDSIFGSHQEHKEWVALTREKLQSLKARDQDYTTRLDNASFTVSLCGAHLNMYMKHYSH